MVQKENYCSITRKVADERGAGRVDINRFRKSHDLFRYLTCVCLKPLYPEDKRDCQRPDFSFFITSGSVALLLIIQRHLGYNLIECE